MRRLGLAAALLVTMVVSVLAQEVDARPELKIDQEHKQWIDHVMRSIATVKPGMTRRELMRVFVEEGGLSTRTRQKYVYHRCPYIKVDVEFAPVEGAQEKSPDDKIVEISRPFLEYSVMD